MDTIAYLQKNFYELHQVCKSTGISENRLYEMIEKGIIPNPSYTVTSTIKIESSLEDSSEIEITEKYFPKSILNLIKENLKYDLEEEYKMDFKNRFKKAFLDHKDNIWGYGNIFNSDGNLNEEKFNQCFEEEWQYYRKGVYGICTLNALPEELAAKEILVKKLIQMNSDDSKMLDDVRNINDEFNKVASLFAPYQRQSSSRGKYLDTLLRKNGLENLIKQY